MYSHLEKTEDKGNGVGYRVGVNQNKKKVELHQKRTQNHSDLIPFYYDLLDMIPFYLSNS